MKTMRDWRIGEENTDNLYNNYSFEVSDQKHYPPIVSTC